MTVELYNKACHDCSKAVTLKYSTSFSSAIKLLHADLRTPIFNIYGFVRLADEIVDTFHAHDKTALLQDFKTQTFIAIEQGISLNPVLHSFQQTVNQFDIDHALIYSFFKSMESDLQQHNYDKQGYEEYIYGSAEVVGLMCLYIFCEGDKVQYKKLEMGAKALGAAFQKVNFLRDIRDDFTSLSRMYFPNCDFYNFSKNDKIQIEEDIDSDFHAAFHAILQLPLKARFGVYVAYKYYYSLFNKIKGIKPAQVLQTRIRIANYHKAYIVLRAGLKNSLRLI
ncbi:MAG: phytoene/squalene synthase family protein [Chitinophagaceae bacterium]